MELFSVASWIYLFIRKGDGVKKTTKVLTLACICCQSCIKLAVIPPQNSFACEKKIQKFATSSIFSKRNQTDSKRPFKGNTKRTCGPRTAVSMCRLDWITQSFFPSDILIKLSSIVHLRKWGKSNAGNRLWGFHLNSYMKYEQYFIILFSK